jgi:hypothetical protein
MNEIKESGLKEKQISELTSVVNSLVVSFNPTTAYTELDKEKDLYVLFNRYNISPSEVNDLMAIQSTMLGKIIDYSITGYTEFTNKLETLVTDIKESNVKQVTIHLLSTTSAIADNNYNKYLSLRRSHSVVKEILDVIQIITEDVLPDKWIYENSTDINISYSFKELGYDTEGEIIFTTKSEGENYSFNENSSCGNYNFINKQLRVITPSAYYCRQTQVVMVYTKKPQTVVANPEEQSKANDPNYKVVSDPSSTIGAEANRRSKPPIDMMKQIIMKTLSECYYFQKLEETDPVVFGSLKEKFKYFHPSFHSMTPEGLNSRLTFLNQCVRPGDTIPIKGVNSALDLRARNTSFGPPPICVLRVGDFYHSKVIVRDVNITFEEGIWDFNPEGIGIQPMIAEVQMQISFIGGQGLEKPVKWLQNALTSNFYANTEMYDPRSITTNEFIGGQKYEDFTKEFLTQLTEDYSKKTNNVEQDTSNKLSIGKYIGELIDSTSLNYRALIEKVFSSSSEYITQYGILYNKIVPLYGKNISSILLSPNYRKNNVYNYYDVVGGSPIGLQLFGLYEKGRDIFVLTSMLESNLSSSLSTINTLSMFGFDKIIPVNKVQLGTRLLNEYLDSFIKQTIDYLNSDTNLKSIESLRDNLVSSLDNVNFIVKYGYDAKLDEGKTTGTRADLSGFTANILYDEYSTCIDYINKNSDKFYEDLDVSINYSNATTKLTDEQFSNIMKDLLSRVPSTEFMSNTFGKDTTVFNGDLTKKLEKAYTKFVNVTSQKEFKVTKFKERARDIDVIFEITTESLIDDNSIVNELISLNKTPNIPINELNYYKI